MSRVTSFSSTPWRRLARLMWCVGATAVVTSAWAQAPVVPVGVVAARAVGQGMELEGVLQAVKQSTLSSQASGRITQWWVKPGDRVKAGQVLAVIDDRVSQAGVNQAQAQVAQADAQLANARAQFARTQDLHVKGFVSKAALDVAESQFKSAQAGASGAQAGQTQSQLAQGFTRLTAPYDGWVLATHAEAGDLAMPGAPLVTVYAPQPMRAVTHVPASRQSAASQAVHVEVRLPDGNWVVPVSKQTVPAADPVSQTVEWRLEMPSTAQAGMVPGQQVQVRFASAQAQRLMVPAQAVLRRGELSAVYVVREAPATSGTTSSAAGFALRAVRLGASHGGAGFEVLAGLNNGDRVALDPLRAGLTGARPGAAQP
ncbi:MAG: efflux RND transporter periplasmic adaptor subunit [Burkholderiales bacterium]|nr:efflux RND transporter periplasmic adaptor subunit [Burkholderiales bacterium]